jgi:2'-5' RNA ligase
MYAIISEIDEQSGEKVNQIWQKLCEACDLGAVYTTPTPHFTWLTAEELDVEKSKLNLSEIVKSSPVINTHTFGLGLFSGGHPVLFLPMVKTIEMIQFHQHIWNEISPYAKDLNKYYSPEYWLPHITLAFKDINRENLACAINEIGFEKIELNVSMTSLEIAEHEDEKIWTILERFPVKN